MILLVDADSLVFASCYRPKEDVDTFYTNLDDVIHKFDESFMKIVNDLSDKYEVKEVLTFNNSKGNFRKLITHTYKANRIGQKKPPLLKEMHDYVQETYDGIYGYGIETDDIVATYWKELSTKFGRENVMIKPDNHGDTPGRRRASSIKKRTNRIAMTMLTTTAASRGSVFVIHPVPARTAEYPKG